MSSNDDDDTGRQGEGERPIAPDRQWVLRPNQVVAPPPDPELPAEKPASEATPTPPVPPPPGAPGTTGPVPPSGRTPQDPQARPNIAAPQAQPAGGQPAAIPITSPAPPASSPAPPAPAAPAAPAASGPVRSWGSQPPAPVAAPTPPTRPAPTPPVQPPAGAADPPTLTPADSATATPPVSRSSSPTNVTLGPPQRNAPAAAAPQAPAAAPQPARPAPAPAQGQGRPGAGGPARGPGKGGPTFADLAQQLAATQAQVAALSAQLTTLAHRLTYDVERGAQTTSERVTRDLERTLAEAVALRVGAHLGPAVDDLTDQIAEDFTPKLESVVETVGRLNELGLDARVAALTDAIDSMPIGNVEVINQIDTLGTDLQDRLQRLSTRLFDQFENLERSQLAELLRVRETVEDLRTAGPASGGTDVETLRRIANHVERLAQRTPGTAGIVAAVETLITEHLDAVRAGLDEQVAALAPTMQVELDAVRSENLQALGSIEHELLEQIGTIEASLVERLDNLLADHLDSVDAVIADRQEGIVEAVSTAGGDRIDDAVSALTEVGTARLEEVAAVANLGADRVEELAASVQELQATIAEEGLGGGGGDQETLAAVEALTSTVVEELQALREKLNETASAPELSPQDIDAIAAAVVRQIRAERGEAQAAAAPPAHAAKPRRGRGG